MQKPQITSTFGRWKASFHYGLLFGGMISLLDILYLYYQDAWNSDYSFMEPTQQPQLADIVGNVLFYAPLYVLLFLFFFLAGILAARKTWRVSSGGLAGLIVGGVFLLVDVCIGSLLLNYLISFPQLAQIPQPASELARAESFLLISAVPYSLVAGFILIGVGALIGTMGSSLVCKQLVSVGILAGLIVGWVFLLGGLIVGGLILVYLISFSQLAQEPQSTSAFSGAESALLVAGLVIVIGVGALIGAISALMRKKRST